MPMVEMDPPQHRQVSGHHQKRRQCRRAKHHEPGHTQRQQRAQPLKRPQQQHEQHVELNLSAEEPGDADRRIDRENVLHQKHVCQQRPRRDGRSMDDPVMGQNPVGQERGKQDRPIGRQQADATPQQEAADGRGAHP